MVCVFSFIFIFTALPSGVAIAAVVIVFNAVSKYSFVEQKNSLNYVSSHAFVMSMSPLIGCLTSCCGSSAARRVRRLGLCARGVATYLPSGGRTYSCVHCRAHLANHDELISKSFQGSQGKAYLFNSVVNVGCGPAEERVLLTGLHAVADIYCECCKTTLGWKYEHAFESSQKYKEGKYIIELAHMIKDNGWDSKR
ncbi:Protein yippee-like 2 [Trichinella sp. T9]|nr:Protein yippee-like 2 [Trichinella sp. T9]KRZ93441.1 Protein yippee-like 2 [Trichinella sp. T8]